MSGAIRLNVLLGTWLLILLACTDQKTVETLNFLAFGTIVSISVYEPPDNLHQNIYATLKRQIELHDKQWKSFGDGELGQINAALENGECADISAATRQLVIAAQKMQKLSDNRFNPTLGIAVDRWGFRDNSQSAAIPDHAATPNLAQLDIQNNTICSSQPVRLDLGGIAKGEITRQLSATLRAHKIHNAIINAGGDLLVMGTRGEKPWRIAIQNPRGDSILASIAAKPGEAFFSSGDYHRFAIIDNRRIHHILDPATQEPVTGTVAVTVIHTDPVLADAAATALFVAGHEEFVRLSQQLGISQALLIDAQMSIHVLPKMRARLPADLNVAQ